MAKKGDRVELISCSDPYTRKKGGERGTVTLVNENSFGTTVFVDWDDGSKLGLVEGEDSYRVIKEDARDAEAHDLYEKGAELRRRGDWQAGEQAEKEAARILDDEPREVGGAFDGFTVTSDADPGL